MGQIAFVLGFCPKVEAIVLCLYVALNISLRWPALLIDEVRIVPAAVVINHNIVFITIIVVGFGPPPVLIGEGFPCDPGPGTLLFLVGQADIGAPAPGAGDQAGQEGVLLLAGNGGQITAQILTIGRGLLPGGHLVGTADQVVVAVEFLCFAGDVTEINSLSL